LRESELFKLNAIVNVVQLVWYPYLSSGLKYCVYSLCQQRLLEV